MDCPAAGLLVEENLKPGYHQQKEHHIHLLWLTKNERIEKYPASRIDDDGKQFISGLCRPKMLLMARLLVSLGGIIVANNGEFL